MKDDRTIFINSVVKAKHKFSLLIPIHLYPFSFENLIMYQNSQNPIAGGFSNPRIIFACFKLISRCLGIKFK